MPAAARVAVADVRCHVAEKAQAERNARTGQRALRDQSSMHDRNNSRVSNGRNAQIVQHGPSGMIVRAAVMRFAASCAGIHNPTRTSRLKFCRAKSMLSAWNGPINGLIRTRHVLKATATRDVATAVVAASVKCNSPGRPVPTNRSLALPAMISSHSVTGKLSRSSVSRAPINSRQLVHDQSRSVLTGSVQNQCDPTGRQRRTLSRASEPRNQVMVRTRLLETCPRSCAGQRVL